MKKSNLKITSLNPDVSFSIMVVSLIAVIIISFYNPLSISAFVLGIIATYPITKKSWNVIEKNWKNVYKKFYSSRLHKRKWKYIKKNWELTWWIIPYTVVVYTAISLTMIYYFNSIYLLWSMIFGAIFINFYITYEKSPKYYKQLR